MPKITSLFFTWANFQNCGVFRIFYKEARSPLDEPETKKVEASVPQPEIEKANVQARVPERYSHVFNLSNCSVVF